MNEELVNSAAQIVVGEYIGCVLAVIIALIVIIIAVLYKNPSVLALLIIAVFCLFIRPRTNDALQNATTTLNDHIDAVTESTETATER